MRSSISKPSTGNAPRLSLVVATLDRFWQLERLLKSLASQSFRDFDVIIVDQNDKLDLCDLTAQARWPFPIRRIATPGDRGASVARNVGWREATGQILVFPDDDAWYPPHFLQFGLERLTALGADLLTGRSTDESGRSINGRYAPSAGPITRGSVWIKQIEWMTFIHRALMVRLGGYDDKTGIGSASPWQAAEGPDLILRALAIGACCHYDPDLTGYHDELETHPPDEAIIAKGRGYGRGMGYVLRKHDKSIATLVYWLARPLAGLVLSAASGQWPRARYFASMVVGRAEGWLRWLAPTSPAPSENQRVLLPSDDERFTPLAGERRPLGER